MRSGRVGASAEQFYVSVSRARDSVTVYTDDKARLAETIQSSSARMTAHELLRLPAAPNVTDPFESILRQKIPIPVPEPIRPDLKRERQQSVKKVHHTASPRESHQRKPFNYFQPERPRRGISL
jgi:hypothetical protein